MHQLHESEHVVVELEHDVIIGIVVEQNVVHVAVDDLHDKSNTRTYE